MENKQIKFTDGTTPSWADDMYKWRQENLNLSGISYKGMSIFFNESDIKELPLQPKPGSFGWVLEHLRAGKKAIRLGWPHGANYVFLIPDSPYPSQTSLEKSQFGDMVPSRVFWAIKTQNEGYSSWVPSGTDTLADDWVIVDYVLRDGKILVYERIHEINR